MKRVSKANNDHTKYKINHFQTNERKHVKFSIILLFMQLFCIALIWH